MLEPAPTSLPARLASFGGRLDGRGALGILAVLLLAQTAAWWIPGRDAGAYLSIARNLSHGQIGRLGSPHLHYAPGYPLLVSPLFLLSDRPFLGLSLAQWVFALVAAWGALRWMRRHVGEAAPALLLLAFVNVGVWALYRATLGELAFLMLVMGAVEALGDLDRSVSIRRLALGGGLLALAVLTRQAGLALLGGIGVVLLLGLRHATLDLGAVLRRVGLACGPAAGLFVLLQWHDATTAAAAGREGARYVALAVAPEQGLAAQLLEGVRLRIAEVGRLLVPGMHKAYAPAGAWLHVNTLIYGAVALGIGYGWVRAIRQRRDLLLWATPFYVLLYVLWPFDQGTRFLAPLMPVWVVALWFALGAVPRVARIRQGVVLVLLLAHLGVSVGAWVRSREVAAYDDRWPRIDRIVAQVGAGRSEVGVLGLDRQEALMLQLALDRPLVEAAEGLPPAPWIVLGADAAVPPGYAAEFEAGPWRLARRASGRVLPGR